MISDSEYILTDEFVEYTSKVQTIFKNKKTLEADFKKQYDDFKAKKAAMEKEAATVHADWEKWKLAQGKADAK